ncbi:DEAD/DEAH box helicase [Candidatus Binatus sp.]|uniref:DEAD/DEAH box helicase n=1 Tax=Candidatus Binatus sp. TaxID=2811406 RepID=UPI003C74BA8A
MTLTPALMAHQEEGVAFLTTEKSGLLAFEQGLGKTLVAIRAFAGLRANGNAVGMLVICPNSLKQNWAAEIAKFEPTLSFEIIEGSARERRRALSSVSAPVVVLSYETGRIEIAGVLALLKRRPTVLVLDESHAVKNRRSLTSIAAQHYAPLCEYRWLLSGTPVTNTAADLYAQLRVITAGEKFGNFDSFVVAANSPEGLEALRVRCAPFIMRRTKDDCLDLPDKTMTDLRVELPPWQRRLYDEMRDKLVCEIKAMTGEQFRAHAPTVLVKLLRLSQIASNPALILPTEPRVPAKFQELDCLIDEIIGGTAREKLIIWSMYVETIEHLTERYAALAPLVLYGGTPVGDRTGIAERFQTDPSSRLLLANPGVAGSGFTLTAARYCVYETVSWRYDFFAQSQDRIHRIGQERAVTCLRLIAADTIEEVIASALDRKASVARVLLGDSDPAVSTATLSREQVLEILVTNKLPTTLTSLQQEEN